jgi:hypothetical protein
MCLETVDGASFSSSMSWQTHSSPPCSASSARTRFSSDRALVMAMTSCTYISYISPDNEMIFRQDRFVNFEGATASLVRKSCTDQWFGASSG